MPEYASRSNLKLEVEATGYCPCDICTDGYTLTYTGAVPIEGHTIATDDNLIPLGTTVIIDGKKYVAEDIGCGIKGNKIDIFFKTHEQAIQYGRQTIIIEIVK